VALAVESKENQKATVSLVQRAWAAVQELAVVCVLVHPVPDPAKEAR
jgi:hypothetical protein